MAWFAGTIPEAIRKLQQEKTLLIVYIHGTDDQSKTMFEILSDAELVSLCSEGIKLKIEAASNECAQFSQFYPVVCVPALFCVTVKGECIEAFGGGHNKDQLIEKLQNAFVVHLQKAGPPSAPTQQATQPPPPPPTSAHGDSAGVQPDQGASVTASGTGANVTGEASGAGAESDGAGLSMEERVERARTRIAEKREQKEDDEEEKEKSREVERRRTGQDMAKMRQWQKEQEQKSANKELKKEREEDKKARERVREQIARDRAEKKEKFAAEKSEREAEREVNQQDKLKAVQAQKERLAAERSESARVQFRFPDGSSRNQVFSAQAPLQEAYDFVQQHIQGSFFLSTSFPRRVFDDSDKNASFRDLTLAPTAAIMVLPGKAAASSRPGGSGAVAAGGGGGVLGWVFYPFVVVWRLFYNFLIGAPPQAPARGGAGAEQMGASGGDMEGRRRAQQRRVQGSGTEVRSAGNIRRLADTRADDDEDNATWNGNSTQQM